MKFCAFALLLSGVAAVDINLESSISSESTLGKKIMANARALNDNNSYSSWIQNYSIKFDGCAQVPRFEREEGFSSDLLAKFKLCPSDSCGFCRNGGEYVVDMKELIEAYQESKQAENEQACENAQEKCEYQCENGYYSYQGDDDEGCQYSCLSAENMAYCAQDQEEDQEMDDIGECRALNEDQQNNNNNNNNGNYNSNYEVFYVGAYCTSKGVFAGTFKDSACTKHAPSGTYEKFTYGVSLPTEALVPSGCIASCDASAYNNENYNDDQNGNNNNNDDQNQNAISDFCEGLYEESAKCEKKVSGISYQDNSGCELINDILPRMNTAFSQMTSRRPSTGAVWAWIFGIACVLMGSYIFLLHKRVIREKVDMHKLGLV